MKTTPSRILVVLCLLASCLAGHAQNPGLSLKVNQSGLTLDYRLSATNEAFFIVNSTNLLTLISQGTIFHAGFSSNTLSGSITSSVLPSAMANFFTLSEYPDAQPEDLEPPINDEESTGITDYFFDVTVLPYPLSANVPIPLTIYVNDANGNPQPVNGTLELTLLDGTRQIPSFTFTITPSTIPVTNGVGQGTITIQSTNSLSACVLAATFSQTSALGPKPLGDGPSPQNAGGGGSTAALTSTTPKPLASYRDPERTNGWLYPLATTFPVNGTFGEWPGHTDIHWGVDLLAPVNTVVRAAKKGIVTKVGKLTAAGNYQFVTLDHGNGCATRYLHIQPQVAVDDILEAGDAVGIVAPQTWTGYAPHFHFELMRNPSDVPANYVYTRGLTQPFPLVNPINTNQLVFTPPLTTLDVNPPEVKAVLITKKNPANNIYNPSATRTFSEAESGISIAYFLAQIVDDEGGKITPMDIHFFADGNPEQIVNYQTSTTVIRNFRANPSTPGYALLPTAEYSSALRNRRYKYWFRWDTASYLTEPIGPRTVRLEVNDVASRRKTNYFTFGPQIKGGVLTPLGSLHYRFTTVAYLGTNTIPQFVQPDQYKLEIIQANGQSLPGVTWTPTPLAGDYTSVFTAHLEEAVYTLTLPGGTSPDDLKLRVSSRMTPDLAHEVPLTGCSQGPPLGVTPVPNMVWIPCGTFTMGSPDSEPGRRSAEGPQTRVTLSQGFWMGKYEVTQGEYLAVIGTNPSYFNGVRQGVYDQGCYCYRDRDYGTDLSRPVELVSWNDAVAYCAALTTREQSAGRLPAGYVYRLPTEAEWEYACRAGTTTPFHYGNELRSGMANFNGYYEHLIGDPYHYNSGGIYLGRTTSVGSYAPNAWGLYDMHGNVWEWCQDWYVAYPGGNVSDPQGPATGLYRVLRGGSWYNYASDCRSAIRGINGPTYRDYFVGFRVVLAPGQP